MQVIDISNEPSKTIEFYQQIVEDDKPYLTCAALVLQPLRNNY